MPLLRWLLVLHLLLSPLLFSRHTAEAFEANKAALLVTTAIAAGAIGLATWRREKDANRKRPTGREPAALARASAAGSRPLIRTAFEMRPLLSAVAIGFLLVAVSAAVSTVTSVSPLLSWRGDYECGLGLRTVLAYVVLFFATRQACGDERTAGFLLTAVAVASFIAAAYALVQWAGLDPFTWVGATIVNGRFRPFSTLGHPNYLGAYLAMALPLIAELGRRAVLARRSVGAVLLAITGICSLAAIALTLSRAAWLATAALIVVLALGWWRSGMRRAGIGMAMCVVAVACALPFVAGERLRQVVDGGGRYAIWRTAWRLFLDRPLCGWGTDTFRLAFGTRRPVEYWAQEGNITPAKAHNEVLHVLTTQGVVGGIAMLVLTIALIRAAWRAWRGAAEADRPLIAAVIAALAAFFVQGLFGFTVVGVGTLFVTLAAFLDRSPRAEPEAQARAWPVSLACAAVAGICLWFAVLVPLRASLACGEGDRLRADDPAAALGAYEQSVAIDPDCDRAWIKLSAAAQNRARRARSTSDWQLLDDVARAAADRAVALVPIDPYHHASRARWLGERAYLGRGDARAALDEWDAALALDPDNAKLLAEAGRSAVALGDRAAAVRHLEHGRSLYPTYAPFWARLGTLALGEGRLNDARALLEESLNRDWKQDVEDKCRARAALATTYLGLREYELARAVAYEAVHEAPGWTTALLLAGQASELTGRPVEAYASYCKIVDVEPANRTARDAVVRLKWVTRK